MCMCDEGYGRSKPFLFLKDIIDTFFLMFNGDETVLEGSTARSFKGVLAQKIKNYSDQPTVSLSSQLSSSDTDPKIEKMRQVKAELDSLASSAKMNIDKVISRGEAIESLVDRTGHLHTSSDVFRKHSKKLNQRLCMENLKLKLMMAVIVLVRKDRQKRERAREREIEWRDIQSCLIVLNLNVSLVCPLLLILFCLDSFHVSVVSI